MAGLSAAPRIRAREGRTLTVEQARQLLDAAAGYRFEAAVVLALAYGMRRGEVLGLHWSALDWKAGTLRVTHSVKRVKDRDASSDRRTRLVVSELKTPKSRRILALTPELVARFRQHRVRQAEAQMAAGPLWQDHGLIFASEVGTPMDPDNFSHSFVRLCERAGLGHWHPHELRHSGASLMLAQGTPCTWSPRCSAMPASPSPRMCTGTCSQRQAGGGRVDEPGPVRLLTCVPVAPSVAPRATKSPLPGGQRACELGALGGTRTPNLLIRSQMLYPLSYERSPCSISRPARWLRLVPTARARARRR